MERHPPDPVSAALGVIAVVLGVLVAADAVDGVDALGSWLAVGALVVGLAIIPWHRTTSAPAASSTTGDVADAAGPLDERAP